MPKKTVSTIQEADSVPKIKPEKKPKVKLISYTMKAVIPTGMYANIQPEITVEAETIEQAERFLMGHIEEMFAKYRSDGSQVPTAKPIGTTPGGQFTTVKDRKGTYEEVSKGTEALLETATEQKQSIQEVAPAIILSEPFKRAKGAVESCMSSDALQLVAAQIEKSVKLIDSEKVELRSIVMIKLNDITMSAIK